MTSRKRIIDPKYRAAYDHLTLAEIIDLRGKLTRDIAQETRVASGGVGLSAEIAAANRRELLAQLNAVEARFAKLARDYAKRTARGLPLIDVPD